jgi:hypothetical protein
MTMLLMTISISQIDQYIKKYNNIFINIIALIHMYNNLVKLKNWILIRENKQYFNHHYKYLLLVEFLIFVLYIEMKL